MANSATNRRGRSRCWSNRARGEADGSSGGLAVRVQSANLKGVAAPPFLAQLAFELRLRVERHGSPRTLTRFDRSEISKRLPGVLQQAEAHGLVDPATLQHRAYAGKLEDRVAMRTVGKSVGVGKVAKVAEVFQETVKVRWIETAAIDAESLGANGIPRDKTTTGELVAALRRVRIDAGLADPIAVVGGDEDASLFAERYAAILSAALLVESTLLGACTLDADAVVAPARASGSALGVGYAIATLVVDA